MADTTVFCKLPDGKEWEMKVPEKQAEGMIKLGPWKAKAKNTFGETKK